MKKQVRVRFAPSPTGPLHIGGVRTALYNYLFAKKNNGKFILRIEDTDQERTVAGAEEYITNALKWCGIEFDEGYKIGGEYAPYKQSERKSIYRQYAMQLIDSGNAYYAFDSAEELDEMRKKLIAAKVPTPQYNSVTRMTMRNSCTLPAEEVKRLLDEGHPYVIRLKVPRKEDVRLKDIIRGWIVVHSSQIDDKVLLKSDGMPTYHLANIVDDHLMKITHVIRGEEWLPSAPLHVLLYRFLGWEDTMPEFAHLPLLLRPDGNGKLSKRDGDQMGMPFFPLEWKNPETNEMAMGYRESGYFPEAFINFLVLLGWNPGHEKEIFTMQELIQEFSLERVGKSGARFDPNKVKWFNQQYLKSYPDSMLADYFLLTLKEKKIECIREKAEKICGAMKERAFFLSDLLVDSGYFFFPPKEYPTELIKKVWHTEANGYLEKLMTTFEKINTFTVSDTENMFNEFIKINNIPKGKLLSPLRLSLTGILTGPSVFEICEILGKEEVRRRIKNACNSINLSTHKSSQ